MSHRVNCDRSQGPTRGNQESQGQHPSTSCIPVDGRPVSLPSTPAQDGKLRLKQGPCSHIEAPRIARSGRAKAPPVLSGLLLLGRASSSASQHEKLFVFSHPKTIISKTEKPRPEEPDRFVCGAVVRHTAGFHSLLGHVTGEGRQGNRRQVTPRARALSRMWLHPVPPPPQAHPVFGPALAYPRRWEANDAELIAPGAETAHAFETRNLAGQGEEKAIKRERLRCSHPAFFSFPVSDALVWGAH